MALLYSGQPFRVENVTKVTLYFGKSGHRLEVGSVRLPIDPDAFRSGSF